VTWLNRSLNLSQNRLYCILVRVHCSYVLLVVITVPGTSTAFRFRADRYGGRALIHCHVSVHAGTFLFLTSHHIVPRCLYQLHMCQWYTVGNYSLCHLMEHNAPNADQFDAIVSCI
jgi:hypothetical protein